MGITPEITGLSEWPHLDQLLDVLNRRCGPQSEATTAQIQALLDLQGPATRDWSSATQRDQTPRSSTWSCWCERSAMTWRFRCPDHQFELSLSAQHRAPWVPARPAAFRTSAAMEPGFVFAWFSDSVRSVRHSKTVLAQHFFRLPPAIAPPLNTDREDLPVFPERARPDPRTPARRPARRGAHLGSSEPRPVSTR